MIPKNATDIPPTSTGPQRVYLPRTRRDTVFWAYWSAERNEWSSPYHGSPSIVPWFEAMDKDGRLVWSGPSRRLHWVNEAAGSDEHLARALRSGD